MIVLNRADWGADTSLPRRGHLIGPARRTEVFIHHTVIIDDDDTPNTWESLTIVKKWMRRLQTIRPDLGQDVPYNFVAFCMRDGSLALCEGRGLDRTGAHTVNHNRSALGIAFQGNFEDQPLPGNFDDRLVELGTWIRDLRINRGFVNLGSSRPADREVWGHRQSTTANTACPGQKLFDKLGLIRFIDALEENEMDKPTWKLVQRALQAQEPPLYKGRRIDGVPGRNTHTAIQAFERRAGLEPRGVIGDPPAAMIWAPTRELLFASTGSELVTE